MNETTQTFSAVFGLPSVLTEREISLIGDTLSALWHLTYQDELGELESDLARCRELFDPIARGKTLRERLSKIPKTPPALSRNAQQLGHPTVTDAGDGRQIVGIEARLLLELLREISGHSYVVLEPEVILHAERRALDIYRRWSMQRLSQVVALRQGQGAEVMQAISVGLMLALLVNRSTTLERAVVLPADKIVTHQIASAVYAGAASFADTLTTGRGRSAEEYKFKGGYGLTEARRRLAHRLTVSTDKTTKTQRIYIPEEYREEVVLFLANDLARRSSLSSSTLEKSFGALLESFQEVAGTLANRSLIFERAGDTEQLAQELLSHFSSAKSNTR